MLKGKTTIRLYGESGELISERSDTNMVTAALGRIIGLDARWTETGGSWVGKYSKLLPTAKKLLGGIILWDGTIGESTGNVMPPSGVNEIGHAGDAYDGANSFRGTYLEDESGEVDGGWRHVWSFGANRANGTVKCVSLTSVYGGRAGLTADVSDPDAAILLNLNGEGGTDLCAVTDVGELNQCLTCYGNTNFGERLHLGRLSSSAKDVYIDGGAIGNTLSLYYVKQPSVTSFALSDSYNKYRDEEVETVEIEASGAVGYPSFVDEADKLYALSITASDSESNTASGSYRVFNLSTGTVSAEKTLSFDTALGIPSNELFSGIAVLSGSLYCYSAARGKYCRFVLGTNAAVFAEELPFDNKGGRFFLHGGRLYFAQHYSTADTVYTYRLWQLAGGVWSCGFFRASLSPEAFLPSMLMKSGRGYPNVSVHGKDCLFTAYLATINNLSEPITKTEGQTMKITYELTEG